jgi:hypothetical protein
MSGSLNGEYQGVPPPKPSLNGGLYTGQPFRHGAPWANVPIVPDAGMMAFDRNFPETAPAEARFMLPGGGIRPGNNMPTLHPYARRSVRPDVNSMCIPVKNVPPPPPLVSGNRGGEEGCGLGSAATRRTWLL